MHQANRGAWNPAPTPAFPYFDVAPHDWRVDPGKYVIYASTSSEDTPLSTEVKLD